VICPIQVEAGACLLAYLLVFVSNGVPLSLLPGWGTDSSRHRHSTPVPLDQQARRGLPISRARAS
jgi:hypothetical protein